MTSLPKVFLWNFVHDALSLFPDELNRSNFCATFIDLFDGSYVSVSIVKSYFLKTV
jgi:hypothetical protein